MALLVSDPDVFEQIVHHIFLPPQLPQERSHARIDAAILRVTSAALAEFEMSLQTQDPMRLAVSRARTTLIAAIDCHSSPDGGISEFVLRDRMERLEVGGTIILQIRAQNAGLIFTRQPQCVRFEVFELAPQNQKVIAAKGRLIRHFPGFALDVPSTTYDDAYFCATLAQTLATMSGQSAPGVQPQILKAGRFVDEERDTTHPAMVTEFLMGFLMAHGRAVDSIITVTKNTRDDVLFKDSEKPWRRSPAYLLIRVSLHLLFTRHLKGSDTLYKAFMAFFMAKLLQNAQRLGISTDLQYAMSAKVARRLQKQTNSGKGMPDHVRKLLHDVQDDCSTAISRAWVDLQYNEYNPCRTLSSLAQLQFSNDSVIDLPLLDDWLAARPFRQSTNLSSPNQLSSELHLHAQLRFPSLQQKLSEEYRIANLHSFEDWCAQSLRASVTAHDIDTVCHQVYSLIVRYHQHARSQYEAASGAPPRPNNPEETSSMILIILELWQAMDKQAVENCSLLAEYDPQIPVALFQNLLLPTRDQMVRLERLEVYLHTRQTRARERLSSDLFGDAKDNDCFAVRYFDQDDAMQALFEDITARGREGREAKIKELYANYERYEKLENEIAGMECSFYTVEIEATSRFGVQSLRRHDDRRCEKCAKIHDRDAMRISVHEWPLPSRQEQAKAVVFELCIPRWYADWRDCTAYLLQDVLQLNNKGADRPKNQYALDKDPHVGQNYHSEGQRIILWTKNKTHVKTHRRTRYVSTAVEKDVCVDNATFYQYLDTESKQFVGRYESHKKAEVACTYLLPQHTRELQPFLFRPADAPDGPSPNMIIASQSLCPSDGMTVDEFKEMCSIPGGTAVQWYNIALQLASPTVDLKKEETVLVFLQCIYQAGPNQDEGSAGTNGVSRASHAVLNHTDLARTLLECLEASLEKIKRNWESMHALVVFTAIASRLLTMNAEVQLDCLSFLQKVRETAFFWLQDVHERAQAAEDHVVRTQFLSKGIDIRSAAMRSFEELSAPNIDMLMKIAALSPARFYYPPDAKVMQSVRWDDQLSFMAQHGDFYSAVGAILQQAAALTMFYPGSNICIPSLKHIEEDLHHRDMIRTAVFRVAEYGAEHFTTVKDVNYRSRDRGQGSPSATKACVMSRLIVSNSDKLHWRLPEKGHLWKQVMDLKTLYGAARPLQVDRMAFDARLMQGNSDEVAPSLLSLHQTLGSPETDVNRPALMMWLSTMALSPDADMALLQVVAMFLTAQSLRAVVPPAAKSFCPAEGQDITLEELQSNIADAAVPYKHSPDAKTQLLRAPYGNRLETNAEHRARCEPKYNRQVLSISKDLARGFHRQWVSDRAKDVLLPEAATKSPVVDYIDCAKMMEGVNGMLETRRNNQALQRYLDDLQVAVSSLSSQPISVPKMAISHELKALSIPGHATVEHVFAEFVPQALRDDRFPRLATQTYTSKTGATSEDACPNLRAVVHGLEEETANQESFKKTYVEGLRGSMNALQLKRRTDDIVQPTLAELNEHLSRCEEFLQLIFANLVTASRTQLEKQSGGREGLHWPRTSPSLFLAQLNRDRWQALPSQWKKPIVQYGIAITAVQRAERLLNAEASKNLDDMQRELSEVGHTNWDPLAQPETLLLEVEGAIMVRDVQEDIAREMRSPSSRGNQVVQLNMGEGKSSVIVPMVAAALGDGKQLVRVIVAKPQSKQMAQMLVSKLGGLLNRRIYFMPYSRALRLTRSSAEAIDELCRECMKMGGILLLQPEHILSFKLTGPESVLAGNKDAGASFLRTQELFDKFSRDIVDESDENFNVKFELVYTLGIRRQVDFAPARWGFVQHFLALVKVHAQALAEQDAKTMEFNTRGEGGFPRIRILQEEVAQELVYRIAKDVTEFGLLGLPTSSQSDTVRASLFKYITTPDLTPKQTAAVETSAFWTANTKQALLLTRGLLAGGILQFVFCLKRWRVTYGLTTRSPATRLAVPYRAKDSPSPRSEFSHPDVVILLTSLSYYYGGLPDEDLFTALGHLMTCDQADAEYRTWLWDVDVPVEYRHLAGINIKDRVHCITKVFPHLRYSKGAIDYWLSHVVFPREMKEYPHKLSASGCDLGRLKTLPTTCFSGTNDSRALLPLDVRQIDIPEQMHTNALVLEYLLRFENTVALMPSTADASATDAEQLLDMVMNLRPVPQVILDVGAFVLELDNKSVAAAWLAKYHANDKSAAVFCNDQDELSVIDRTGRIELLQTSSYKERMDMCIVYLDEAHTRGIDLKLPVHWRAACTLGANLSKDRLVQACMRMRKLGKGQTIVFCVPNEIKESILRDRAEDETNVEITTASVVRWVILQTWTEIKHSMALWVAQNHRFNIQKELWDKNTVDGHYQLDETSAREFREEEARTLDYRYRPKPSKKAPLEILAKDTKHRSRAIIARCELYGMLSFNARKLTEEQERELSPECDVDAERVVQKPPAAQAAQHHLHRDILSFVMTGEAKQRSSAYGPAFHTLSNTSPALHFDVTQFQDQRMLASTDFSRTILDSGKGALHDSYQRSVQWVLTGLGKSDSTAEYIIIISPYEAQRLVARGALLHSRAALHLYRPRYNVRYRPMEKLDFYQISSPALTVHVPLSLSVQLGVFAGQLYWNSYAEYVATTRFLGLLSKPAEQGQEVTMDGFIRNNEVGLCSSPVDFLKVFLSKIRRGGDDISKTHMGMLLDGKVFRSADFE